MPDEPKIEYLPANVVYTCLTGFNTSSMRESLTRSLPGLVVKHDKHIDPNKLMANPRNRKTQDAVQAVINNKTNDWCPKQLSASQLIAHFGGTLLHFAAMNESGVMVGYFLNLGISPNTENAHGLPPLHAAYVRGEKRTIAALSEAGAKHAYKGKGGHTALFAVAMGNHHEYVDELVNQYSIDINAQVTGGETTGRTALHYASKYGRLEVAKMLVFHGANPYLSDKDGKTPEALAREARTSSAGTVVGYLQELYRKADEPFYKEIVKACQSCDVDELEALLNPSPDTRAPYKTYENNRCHAVDRALASSELSQSIGTAEGKTLPVHAIETQDFNIIETVRRARPELLKKKDAAGKTIIHLVCGKRDYNPAIIEWLSRKLDTSFIDQQDENGRTALHEACANGEEIAARILVSHGADVTVTDHQSCTPIMLASAAGHQTIVTYLESRIAPHGASLPTSGDNDGLLDFVRMFNNNREAMLKLIEEERENIEYKNWLSTQDRAVKDYYYQVLHLLNGLPALALVSLGLLRHGKKSYAAMIGGGIATTVVGLASTTASNILDFIITTADYEDQKKKIGKLALLGSTPTEKGKVATALAMSLTVKRISIGTEPQGLEQQVTQLFQRNVQLASLANGDVRGILDVVMGGGLDHVPWENTHEIINTVLAAINVRRMSAQDLPNVPTASLKSDLQAFIAQSQHSPNPSAFQQVEAELSQHITSLNGLRTKVEGLEPSATQQDVDSLRQQLHAIKDNTHDLMQKALATGTQEQLTSIRDNFSVVLADIDDQLAVLERWQSQNQATPSVARNQNSFWHEVYHTIYPSCCGGPPIDDDDAPHHSNTGTNQP